MKGLIVIGLHIYIASNVFQGNLFTI